MRVSNLQFSKGAVVFAEFPPTSADAFMNNRPLVVVSNPVPIFNQVIVCQTGTKMKPGIQIRLWNYQANRALGSTDVSTIYPYNLVTIKTESIRQCVGHIDPYTMKAVDKAVSFFLGYSDEVPEFMKQFEDEYFGVSYTYANPTHVYNERIGETFQRRMSFDSRTQYPVFIVDEKKEEEPPKPKITTPVAPSAPVTEIEPEAAPPKKYVEYEEQDTPVIKVNKTKKPVITSTPTTKTPQAKPNYKHRDVEAFLKKYTFLTPTKSVTSKDLREVYERVREKEGWKEITFQGFGRAVSAHFRNIDAVTVGKSPNGNALYKGVTVNISEEEKEGENIEDLSLEIRNWMLATENLTKPLPEKDVDLLKEIGTDNACIIISRKATIGTISYKYKLSNAEANMLRDRLTKYAIESGENAITYLKGKPNGIGKYSNFFKLGVAFVTHFSTGPNAAKLRVRLNENLINMRNTFKINFEDSDVWGDFRKKYFP